MQNLIARRKEASRSCTFRTLRFVDSHTIIPIYIYLHILIISFRQQFFIPSYKLFRHFIHLYVISPTILNVSLFLILNLYTRTRLFEIIFDRV